MFINKQPHLKNNQTQILIAMKGMTNISVNARMKQMLILISLILAGILFALTSKSWDSQSSKEKLKADVTESFK